VFTDNTWSFIHATYDGANILSYVNAGNVATRAQTGSMPSNANPLTVGFSDSDFYTGRIDELRISNIVRSTTWMSTEYNNQNSPSTFYTIGAEEIPTVATNALFMFGGFF
jgi:hypothetical protein